MDHHHEQSLTVLFDVDVPEQAEALHVFRAAFGITVDIEAVSKSLRALHIRPGHPSCTRLGEKRERTR
jgi:hypothetical protein